MGWPAKKIERSDLSLTKRAKKILEKKDSFLFVFDVKESRHWNGVIGLEELYRRVDAFCRRVTKIYKKNIVRGERTRSSYFESFIRIIGDGGGGYFNSAEVITEIMALAHKELYPIEFWWNVAEDIWDEENSRIIS